MKTRKKIQATSTHELQHIVDFQNTDIAAHESASRRKLKRQLRALSIGSLFVAPLAAVGAMEYATSDIVLSALAGGAVSHSAVKLGAQRAFKMQMNHYNNSPSEERARAASLKASELPTIISYQ